jgi:hypothetical protein
MQDLEIDVLTIVPRLHDQYTATAHVAFQITPELVQRQLLHGLARRLKMIAENTRVILEIAHPGRMRPLSNFERVTTSIHLNSFYMHLRGSLDNLAWALTYQFALLERRPDGEPKRRQDVDLFGKQFLNELNQQSPALFAVLKPRESWRLEIADLRDPVAHRIPIYAVPTTLNQKEYDQYRRTDIAAKEAFAKMDIDLANDLYDQLDEIGTYKPLFAHDFSSPRGIREIYPQVLNDAEQLLELCVLILPSIRNN